MKAGWSEDGGQAEGCSQHTEFAKLSTDQSGEETGHFEIFSAVKMQLLGLNMVEINMPGCVCLLKNCH